MKQSNKITNEFAIILGLEDEVPKGMTEFYCTGCAKSVAAISTDTLCPYCEGNLDYYK